MLFCLGRRACWPSQLNYLEELLIRNLGRYVMASFAYSAAGFKREKGGVEIRL